MGQWVKLGLALHRERSVGLGALAFAIFSGCAPSGPKPLSVGGPDCRHASKSRASAACERFAIGHLLVELKPEVALAPFTRDSPAQSLVAPDLPKTPCYRRSWPE